MKKFRFKFQAITSTISCMLVLILIGITTLCAFAIRNISEDMRENFIVTLTLGGSNDALLGTDEGFSSQKATMQQNLQHERFIQKVEFISSDEVLQQQLDVIGGNPEDFLGFNPYYSEFELELKPIYVNTDSLKVLSKELQTKYPLVSEVTYEKDLMKDLNTNINKVTFVLLALAGLLLIILITLINNLVRMSIFARRFHIHTMKLVGASYWFIRKPFIIRSLWISFISSLLASGILFGFIEWLFHYDKTYCDYLSTTDILLTIGTIFVVGFCILTGFTFVSVNHFLSKREDKMYF